MHPAVVPAARYGAVTAVISSVVSLVITVIGTIVKGVEDAKEITSKVEWSQEHISDVAQWLQKQQRTVQTYGKYVTNPTNYWNGDFSTPKNPAKSNAYIEWLRWTFGPDAPESILNRYGIRPWSGPRDTGYAENIPPNLVGFPITSCIDYLQERISLLAMLYPIQRVWSAYTGEDAFTISQDEITDQGLLDLAWASYGGRWPDSLQTDVWNSAVEMYAAGALSPTWIVPYAVFGFNEADVASYGLAPAKGRLFNIQVLSELHVYLSARTVLMFRDPASAEALSGTVPLLEAREMLIMLAQDPDPVAALAAYKEQNPAPVDPAALMSRKQEAARQIHAKAARMIAQIHPDLTKGAVDGSQAPQPNYLPLYFAAGIWGFVGLIRPRL